MKPRFRGLLPVHCRKTGNRLEVNKQFPTAHNRFSIAISGNPRRYSFRDLDLRLCWTLPLHYCTLFAYLVLRAVVVTGDLPISLRLDIPSPRLTTPRLPIGREQYHDLAKRLPIVLRKGEVGDLAQRTIIAKVQILSASPSFLLPQILASNRLQTPQTTTTTTTPNTFAKSSSCTLSKYSPYKVSLSKWHYATLYNTPEDPGSSGG
ncbi:hypothetical protein BKA65DRAFT_191648 [Rhexocercosporidium sp. MPI-PUGE-AT-0058]|nr:hypothetical protein BKA65DRAFT_191648 [Rhexocercosporidium sp. MPI-PUGE-AT-0058]